MSRPLSLVAVLLVTAGIVGCGGADADRAAPGTPDNPLVATPQEESPGGVRVGEPAPSGVTDDASATSRYEALVEGQASKPRERFTPCNLVTAHEARAIVGAPLEQPFEAPQGPTCIYRAKKGGTQVSLAVQSADFRAIKPRIRGLRTIDVNAREAYCGTHGQPMLYLPLGGGRLLSVSTSPGAPGQGRCGIARDFARQALQHL